jgi:PAS domain S-box-containing protein
MSFSRKILTILFILLPVIFVAVYGFLQTRTQLIKYLYQERRTLATVSSRVLSEKLDHLKDVGLSFSERPFVRHYIDKKEWRPAIELLKDVPYHFPFISRIFITDTAGFVKAGAPLTAGEIVEENQSNLDWYKGFKYNWRPYVSEVYKPPETLRLIVSAIALPVINDGGKICGILVMQFDVAKFLAWSSNPPVGKSGFVYIVDQKGHIVVSPDYVNMDSVIDYSSVPAVQKALHEKASVEVLYNPIARQECLYAYERIPEYGWAVIVQQEAGASLSLNDSLRTVLIFYLFILLLALVLALFIIKEISQRKKSHAEMNKYTEIVENTHTLIRNMNDQIVFWNKGMEKLYGWSREEVLGKTTHALFSTEFPEPLGNIENTLLSISEWQGELKHIIKDGSILYVSSHWYLHRDKKGEPIAILETNNDITNFKKAQEKLSKSEEGNRLLIANVKDYAIFILDPIGKVVSWNSGAEHIKGYKEKEILGKSLEVFYTEEDRKKGEPFHNLEMAEKLGHYEKEGWRLRKDGTLFWANVIFTALHNEHGSLYGFSKITRDITERKKAQEELEFLYRQINLSNDAIYTLDGNFNIKSWNKGAESLYGFREAEVLGKNSNALLNTAISNEEIKMLVGIIGQDDHWSGELKRKTKFGNHIFINSSTTVIRDNLGKISGYVVVNLDISNQKKLREEVNQLATMIEHSSEAIILRGKDHRVMSWNKGAEMMFGFAKNEAIGKDLSVLLNARLSADEAREMESRISELGIWKTELDYFRKDGSSFFGAVTANATKNDLGELEAIIFMIRDTSERKRLEDRLKKLNEGLEAEVESRTNEILKNEKRFQALIENSNDIIVLKDRSFKVIYHSPSASRICGWTNKELEIENNFENRIHPDDREKVLLIYAQIISHPDRQVPISYRILHRNGQYIWVDGIIINMLNEEHINAIVLNIRDITERVEAEEKILSSELRFRSLIENSAEGIALVDKFSNIIYKSPAGFKITGNSLDKNTMANAHPSYLGYIKNKFAESLKNPGIPIPFEGKFLNGNGQYYWMEGTLTNLLETKGVNAVVSNFRDITERRKMLDQIIEHREQLELFIRHSPVSLAMFDMEMRYLAVSRRWITEYDLEGKELIGRNHYEIFPELSNEWKEIHQRCLHGEILKNEEDAFFGADGVKKWLRWEIRPWHRASGGIGGIIIFTDFITERKMIEERIKHLNIELEQKVSKRTEELVAANTEMESFSYSISHDLRAPLRAIIGFTNILEEEYVNQLDEEAKRIAGVIKSSTLKMGQLIDDLLMFSRMGRQDIMKIHVDSDLLVKEIIQDQGMANDTSSIEWKLQNLPDVNADLNTLRQVWVNLISNAIKYSGKVTNPCIEIGSYEEEKQTVFFIKDNGIGFDVKYKNKLFKVFQRLHASNEFEGTGIGLAIVDKIISNHRGRVWAEAEINKGACFYFGLPKENQNKKQELLLD